MAYGVANVVLGVVAATVYARGPYGDRPRVETPAQLYRLLAAGVIGSMVSMPIGVGGPVLLMHEPLGHVVQWVLRSTISVVIVGIVGFRLAIPGNRELGGPSMPTRIIGIALTLLVYGFVFTSSDQVWFYLLVPVSMYMALRTDVRTTACHTVAVSSFAIVASLIGLGPLHDVDVTVRGLLAQGIVVVLSIVAMTLVLDREHHERLNSSIEAHRLASAGQAELLERLVASLQDGVLLTAEDGSIVMHNKSARSMLARLGRGDGQLPACLFDPQFDELKPLNRVFLTGEEVVQDVPVPDTAPIVEIVACSTEGDQVDVTVADRGIGLPPGEEERVFAEFHRVPAHASEYSGTGLGLAICRRVVERLNGRIWAVARDGGGTCFRFTLAAADPPDACGEARAASLQARSAAAVALNVEVRGVSRAAGTSPDS